MTEDIDPDDRQVRSEDQTTCDMAPESAGDVSDPLLVLDLLGVSADGTRMYRTVEHHVEGTVDLGFVRTFD